MQKGESHQPYLVDDHSKNAHKANPLPVLDM